MKTKIKKIQENIDEISNHDRIIAQIRQIQLNILKSRLRKVSNVNLSDLKEYSSINYCINTLLDVTVR